MFDQINKLVLKGITHSPYLIVGIVKGFCI